MYSFSSILVITSVAVSSNGPALPLVWKGKGVGCPLGFLLEGVGRGYWGVLKCSGNSWVGGGGEGCPSFGAFCSFLLESTSFSVCSSL